MRARLRAHMYCPPLHAWQLLTVFHIHAGSLAVITFTSVILSLAITAGAIAVQVRLERRRAIQKSLAQKARRLRWEIDDTEVTPPEIKEDWYHVFLSQ